MLMQVLTFVLDQAAIRDASLGKGYEKWPITIVMPEIRPKNLHLAAQTFETLVNATHQGVLDGVVTPEVAKEVYVLALAQLGIDIPKASLGDAEKPEVVAPATGGFGAPRPQSGASGAQKPAVKPKAVDKAA
jgi:hypothetical protein